MIDSLTEPTGENAALSAVRWIDGTLLGTAATSIAVVAVAYIGLLMLTGRMPIRRGLTVVLGCFLIFGARGIVDALEQISAREQSEKELAQEPIPATPPRLPTQLAPPSTVYDPYAGASVPVR